MLLCLFLLFLSSIVHHAISDIIMLKGPKSTYCMATGESTFTGLYAKGYTNDSSFRIYNKHVEQKFNNRPTIIEYQGNMINSLNYSMAPLEDLRWNELKTYRSYQSLPLDSNDILTFKTNVWNISFSILGYENAYIILRGNPSTEQFYCLYFDAFNKATTEIRKCSKNIRFISQCATILGTYHGELLRLNEWHHFILSWNNGNIRVWSKTLMKMILNINDQNNYKITSLKIKEYIFRTLWKFHIYDFTQITETSGTYNFYSPNNGIFSFFYYLEGEAEISIFVNGNKIKTLNSNKDLYRQWRSFQTAVKKTDQVVFSFIKLRKNDEIFLDKLFFYSGDFIFSYINFEEDATCSTLDGMSDVNRYLKYELKNPDCLQEDCNLECSLVTPNCNDYLFCSSLNNDCRCRYGSQLFQGYCQKCQSNMYGLGCTNKCGNCVTYYNNPTSCDTKNGECLYCRSGYLMPYCNETYPISTEAPILKNVGINSAVIEIHLTYDGPQPENWNLLIKHDNIEEFTLLETFNPNDTIIEKKLANLTFSTDYYVLIYYYIENSNIYNYLPSSNKSFLKFRTKCQIKNDFEINYTNTSLKILQKSSPAAYDCSLNEYNFVLSSEKGVKNQTDLNFDIIPYTDYYLSIYFNFDLIYSENFTSLEGVPTQVTNITFSTIGSNSVEVTWNPPENKNGIIQNYLINIQLVSSIGCIPEVIVNRCPLFDTNKEFLKMNSKELDLNIKDLKEYTLYVFEIIAITNSFTGLPQYSCVKTKGVSKPTIIPTITIDKINAKSIIFYCDPPKNCTEINAPIQGYEILIINENETKLFYETNRNSVFYIENLIPYTNYSLIAKIKSENNISSLQEFNYTFQTQATVPGPLRDIFVYNITKKEIYIRYKLPYPPNGIPQNVIIYRTINYDHKYLNGTITKCNLWPNMFCLKTKYLVNNDYLIKAVNQYEKKGPYSVIDVSSISEVASEPLNLNVSIQDQMYLISWEHPAQSNGYFNEFILNVSFEGTNLLEKPKTQDKTETILIGEVKFKYEFEIELKPSTNYTIIVWARKKTMDGKKQIFYYLTPPVVVTPPEWNIKKIESSNFTISFEKSSLLFKELTKQSRIYIIIEKIDYTNENEFKFLEKPFKEQDFQMELYTFINFTQINYGWIAKEIMCEKLVNKMNINFGLNNSSLGVDGVAMFHDKPLDEFSRYKIHLVLVNGRPGFWRFSSNSKELSDIERSKTWLWILIIFLILSILVIVLVIFKKKFRSPQHIKDQIRFSIPLRKRSSENILEADDQTTQLKKKLMPPSESTSDDNQIENVKETILTKRMQVRELEEYVEGLYLHEDNFKIQHSLVPSGQTKPWTQGSLPQNKPKNRYANMLPYDFNRVHLTKLPDDPYSDYINASFIDGYKTKHFYIATQGPKKNTINDFWRMVVENRSQIIAMVTNLIESGKNKCEQYWPEVDHSQDYGNVNVQTIRTQVFADFIIRTFEVISEIGKWKIQQLHFTSWPDHGVPLYLKSVASFAKKLLATPKGNGPIIIHCSAGVGRTGTIMLIDLTLRMAAEEGYIDILGFFQKLRQQRAKMVDTPDQYKLVHQVVVECLAHDNTSIPCDFKFIQNISDLKNNGKIAKQWTRMRPRTMHLGNDDNQQQQPTKNRDSHILPSVKGRVFLQCWPFDDQDSSYINAVYVDGFRSKDLFIVTQHPLPTTYGDFWRLISEKKIRVIVSLNDYEDFNDPTVVPLEPEDDVNKHLLPGFLTIKKRNEIKEEDWTVITLNLIHEIPHLKDPPKIHTVELIKFTGWYPNHTVPVKLDPHSALIQLWSRVERFQTSPIVITCFNGADASGLFVALAFLIEMIKNDQECDVIQTISVIRESRAQFIASQDQFEFLYDAAMCYVKLFETYSNFN